MDDLAVNKQFAFLKIGFIFAYILVKLKFLSIIFAKGLKFLGELYVLPLPITFLVSLNFTSDQISIIITILIYCLLTYQISPRLMKPLFGEIILLWWIRIIIITYTCIIFYWLTYMLDYTLSLVTFLLLSGIVFGKLMLDKSDMVNWKGSIPTFFNYVAPNTADVKKEILAIRSEYRIKSKNPWIKRKLIKLLPIYASGLVLMTVCFFLGILFWVFVQSSILFILIIVLWVFGDIYNLILPLLHKKYVFKWGNVPGNDNYKLKSYIKNNFKANWVKNATIIKSEDENNIYLLKNGSYVKILLNMKDQNAIIKINDYKTHELKVKKKNGILLYEKNRCKIIEVMRKKTIEEFITIFTLCGNKETVLKQFGGFLFFVLSFLAIASNSNNFFYYISNFQLIMSKDIETFTIGLISSTYGLSFICAVFFQLYFIYVLMNRFPHFLSIWNTQNKLSKVSVPRFPTGGFAMFIFNTILINSFLNSPKSLLYLIEIITYFLHDVGGYVYYQFMVVFLTFFIILLLLFFEIYLLYSSFKNRNNREIRAENLYKDNIIIPFATTFQWFSFDVIPYFVTFFISYYGGLPSSLESVNLNRAGDLQIILNHIITSLFMFYILILFFYSDDVRRSSQKKYMVKSIKSRIIEHGLFFAITFVILIYGFLFNNIKFYYLGVFGTIAIVVAFILLVIYDGAEPP